MESLLQREEEAAASQDKAADQAAASLKKFKEDIKSHMEDLL
jgi:hypothetical protein